MRKHEEFVYYYNTISIFYCRTNYDVGFTFNFLFVHSQGTSATLKENVLDSNSNTFSFLMFH